MSFTANKTKINNIDSEKPPINSQTSSTSTWPKTNQPNGLYSQNDHRRSTNIRIYGWNNYHEPCLTLNVNGYSRMHSISSVYESYTVYMLYTRNIRVVYVKMFNVYQTWRSSSAFKCSVTVSLSVRVVITEKNVGNNKLSAETSKVGFNPIIKIRSRFPTKILYDKNVNLNPNSLYFFYRKGQSRRLAAKSQECVTSLL